MRSRPPTRDAPGTEEAEWRAWPGLAAEGVRLRLVAVTDGEASHPGLADMTVLAARRVNETTSALDRLGAHTTEIVRLGMPDAGLAAREAELGEALRGAAAGFQVCLAPWNRDAHVWVATTDADTLVPPCWLKLSAHGWEAIVGTVM